MGIEELLAEVSELARRLANVVRYGRIMAVDHDNALVRVESGGIKTDWIPFFASLGGNFRSWAPPAIGEQCMVLSPGGNTGLGAALRGLYSEAYDQPSKAAELWLMEGNGLTVSYDSASHTLTLSRASGLRFVIKASSISFEADTAEIKNGKCNLIPTLAEMAGIMAGSKTPTMMGDRESIDNATKLPPLTSKLESFIG